MLACRFDVRRAYKPSVMQAVKTLFHVGGHVYGYGAYFAANALYSHWWSTRVWDPVGASQDQRVTPAHPTAPGTSKEYQLILAHVYTGRCKDYGSEWSHALQVRDASTPVDVSCVAFCDLETCPNLIDL